MSKGKPIVHLAEPRMFTVKEAAAFFSMSPSWIRERVRAGDLQAFLCGNLLISGQSMNRYLASRAVGPQPVTDLNTHERSAGVAA